MPTSWSSKPSPGETQAMALLTQADQLRQQGQLAAALEPMRQAAQLLPNDHLLFYNLAMSCLAAGLPRDAASALERVRQLEPGFAEAHWRLGELKAAYGAAEPALVDLKRAVELKPTLAVAWYRLGRVELGQWRNVEAIEALRRARSAAGATTIGWLAEALIGELEGDNAALETAIRRAAADDPDNAEVLEVLGELHVNAGRFVEAADCFRRILEVQPRLVGAWYQLVRLRRLTEADAPVVERIRAAAQQPGLEPAALEMLQLAYGKAVDDLGEPGEAMKAYDAASAMRAGRIRFDLAVWRARIDRIIEMFPADRLAAGGGSGSEDQTPVLIVGMPRSGTTLVEQIVSGHPDVVGGGELMFWLERVQRMEAAGQVDAALVSAAAGDYLAYIRRLGPTAARITDKLPTNFLAAGLIHLAFPRATIIHCRRKPIDVAISIHQTSFSDTLQMPTGGEDLVGYYRAYEKLMAHWRAVLPSDRLVEVEYEQLIASPEPQIRRLIAATGLPWDDACLHPERNDRVVKTASRWQARQPINAGSVDRWRRYEPYLGPLAALLD